MTAPDIRAQAIEVLARAMYEDATSGSSIFAAWDELGEARKASVLRLAAGHVDALAEAGLLPTRIEWAVRFERQAAAPTMDNPSGVITQTMPVRDEGVARQAVRNGVPINAMNRRVCSRPVGEWMEVGE